MDSTFMEKIIKKKKNNNDYLKIFGIALGVFLVIIFSLGIPFLVTFAPLLIVGSAWGGWWLITGLNKEYEYTVTENFIDIDCIIALRKRVRVFSGDVKEFEICARTNTDYYKDYTRSGRIKIFDYAPTPDTSKNYFFVTKNNAKKAKTKGQTVLIVFEPDERMVPSFRKYNPSKVKVDGMF
ncbi:MAG: hypothetical protein ACYCYI_01100 [Saccharofermentanales bacterium]